MAVVREKLLIRDIYCPSMFTQELKKIFTKKNTNPNPNPKHKENSYKIFICTPNWGQSIDLQDPIFILPDVKKQKPTFLSHDCLCIRWKVITLLWLEEPPGGATEPRFVPTARKEGQKMDGMDF